MERIVKEVSVWVSMDGKEFLSQKDCQDYEAAVSKMTDRLMGVSVTIIAHQFEATEGRGYDKRTYVFHECSQMALIDWAITQYGTPLAPWYGTSFYEAWKLHPQTLTKTADLNRLISEAQHHQDVCGYLGAVFLTEGEALPKPEGSFFTEPVRFWPRTPKLEPIK